MKIFNSIDDRRVVETTVKTWEISGGQVFHRWILVTPLSEFYFC